MKFHSQSGIAIGPILFIIAVIAILAAAIAASDGSFTAGTSTESSTSSAQALIQYADQLKAAVQFVTMQNNCADIQLKFQGNNSNAPSDHSCDIFNVNGGNMADENFTNLPGAFNAAQAANNSSWWGTYGHFDQEYGSAVTGLGTQTNAQLLFDVHNLSLATCTAINKILNYNGAGNYAPPNIGFFVAGGYFTGTYVFHGPYGLPIQQGCVYEPTYTEYAYLGSLLVR
jgi:hypothetical protein